MEIPYIDWEIIAKSLREELVEEEQQQLDVWLSASPAHRIFYERAMQGGPTNPETGLSVQELEYQKKMLFEHLFHTERNRILRKRIATCAALLVLLISSWLFFKGGKEQVTGSPEALLASLPAIPPGRDKAILTLDDGEEIDLDSLTDGGIHRAGARIKKDKHALIYTAGKQETIHYNKLFIPRGGEYRLVLADGTKVWINSCTELVFPMTFSAEERTVELDGEAYFEVAKEMDRPFKVFVSGLEVKVYGTKFNVNSYEEGRVQTTLLEGRVGVGKTGQKEEQVLQPNEQSEYDLERDEFRLKQVNANDYVAWKNGEFVFTDQTIETIMRRLAIWYDVQVEYQNEAVRQKRFTGVVERYVTIDKILYYISETATVHFSTDGKKIFVK